MISHPYRMMLTEPPQWIIQPHITWQLAKRKIIKFSPWNLSAILQFCLTTSPCNIFISVELTYVFSIPSFRWRKWSLFEAYGVGIMAVDGSSKSSLYASVANINIFVHDVMNHSLLLLVHNLNLVTYNRLENLDDYFSSFRFLSAILYSIPNLPTNSW